MNKARRVVSDPFEFPLLFKNDDTTILNNKYETQQNIKDLKKNF